MCYRGKADRGRGIIVCWADAFTVKHTAFFLVCVCVCVHVRVRVFLGESLHTHILCDFPLLKVSKVVCVYFNSWEEEENRLLLIFVCVCVQRPEFIFAHFGFSTKFAFSKMVIVVLSSSTLTFSWVTQLE